VQALRRGAQRRNHPTVWYDSTHARTNEPEPNNSPAGAHSLTHAQHIGKAGRNKQTHNAEHSFLSMILGPAGKEVWGARQRQGPYADDVWGGGGGGAASDVSSQQQLQHTSSSSASSSSPTGHAAVSQAAAQAAEAALRAADAEMRLQVRPRLPLQKTPPLFSQLFLCLSRACLDKVIVCIPVSTNVLRCAVLRCAVLCCAALCCAALYCAALALRCTALRCAVLRCAVLRCAAKGITGEATGRAGEAERLRRLRVAMVLLYPPRSPTHAHTCHASYPPAHRLLCVCHH
jgi:hypothetical protein